MNNQIIVPNVYNYSPDEFFDGSAYIPMICLKTGASATLPANSFSKA